MKSGRRGKGEGYVCVAVEGETGGKEGEKVLDTSRHIMPDTDLIPPARPERSVKLSTKVPPPLSSQSSAATPPPPSPSSPSSQPSPPSPSTSSSWMSNRPSPSDGQPNLPLPPLPPKPSGKGVSPSSKGNTTRRPSTHVVQQTPQVVHHPSHEVHHPSQGVHHPSHEVHHLSQAVHHPSQVVQHPSTLSLTDEQVLEAPWYYPGLTWAQASSLLASHQVGTFLLRDSAHPDHRYTLSVQTERGPSAIRICHHRATTTASGVTTASTARFSLDKVPALQHQLPAGVQVGASLEFPSLVGLVEHYYQMSNRRRELWTSPLPGGGGGAGGGGGRNWVLTDGSGKVVPIRLEKPLVTQQVASLQHLCRLSINRSRRTTTTPHQSHTTTIPTSTPQQIHTASPPTFTHQQSHSTSPPTSTPQQSHTASPPTSTPQQSHTAPPPTTSQPWIPKMIERYLEAYPFTI